MTTDSDTTELSIAQAEGKLARLGVQVDSMRAVLVRLLQDVVRTEGRLERGAAARLMEVNEQLVVSALASRDDAETATRALRSTTESLALDALTGLPNRTLLLDRFERAAAQARHGGSRLALLFLDLDHFKAFNDLHGHAFGDQVLRLVAERLVGAVRAGDTVSRHGGDEFLVLLVELNEPDDARAVAEKLMAAISAPAAIAGQTVSIVASAGIAVYPDDGREFDTLVARADSAMYDTKRGGKGGLAFHGATPDPGAEPLLPADTPQAARRRAGDAAESARRQALLREANEKLVLAALSAQELKDAAEQARQRQLAFVAAVADELRNPMAPIRIAAAMIGRLPDADPLLPQVQGIVEQQMAHMSRLVGDLVESSNIDSSAVQGVSQTVSLAAAIAEAVTALRPTLQQREQIFESDLPAGALEVQGDAARLEQVVSNLLDNASKHTQDGGHISLSVIESADVLTLMVADNGIGITPQTLPHIFEPFVQDAQALGFNGVGLGIGLTVVRALVRLHGGNLVARSEGANRGSQFVVTLPRAPAPRAVPANGSASPHFGTAR
jgi:diguanylate cyclase (GGDEF)-like protein